MPAEIAVVLSDNIAYWNISRKLKRSGVSVCHAPSLADLQRIESLFPPDLIVMAAGVPALDGAVFPTLESRMDNRRPVVLARKKDGSWIPAEESRARSLLAD